MPEPHSVKPGPSLVQKLWFKLDATIHEAMQWSGIGKNKDGPEDVWDQATSIDWMSDRIAFLEASGGGRGLAEALVIMCTPAFKDADDVMSLAMKRYTAIQGNADLPPTPGFEGTALVFTKSNPREEKSTK